MLEAVMILAQLSSTPQPSLATTQENDQIEMVLAQCEQTEPSDKYSYRVASATFAPAFAIRRYIAQQSKFKNNDYNVASAKVSTLEMPKYGKLSFAGMDFEFGNTYAYTSNPGYLGKDKVVSLVKLNGKSYKIATTIYIVQRLDDNELCANIKRLSDSTLTSVFTAFGMAFPLQGYGANNSFQG